MAQLFANHLVQKVVPPLLSGHYDPEQELWVGDNQLEGRTQTSNPTWDKRQTPTLNYVWTGLTLDADPDWDITVVPDTTNDSDNP